MNTKLITQADAISAIRSQYFVIGSISANGDFSVSSEPVLHIDATTARAEARRLARIDTGKTFVILKLELVPTNSISI